MFVLHITAVHIVIVLFTCPCAEHIHEINAMTVLNPFIQKGGA